MLRFIANKLIAPSMKTYSAPKVIQRDSLVKGEVLKGNWVRYIEEQRFVINPQIDFERGLIMSVSDNPHTFWTSNVIEAGAVNYDFTHVIRSGGMTLAGHFVEYDESGAVVGLVRPDRKRVSIFLLTNTRKVVYG